MTNALKSLMVIGLVLTSVVAQADDIGLDPFASASGQNVTSLEEGSGARWGLSYFNLGSVDREQLGGDTPSGNIYQYLSFNYKFARDQRFAIRTAMSMTTPGVNDFGDRVEYSSRSNDLHLVYNNYEMAVLPGDWNVVGRFYAYIPTSESSQEKRWVTRLRAWITSEKVIDHNWAVGYQFKPEFFVNTQQAYRSERTFVGSRGDLVTTVQARNNKIGELEHYFEFSRYVNSYLTPKVELGMMHEWFFTSAQVSRGDPLREKMFVGLGTWININRGLRFLVTARDIYEIRPVPDRREAELTLMTFWTIL